MTENVENIILEHLKRFQTAMDRVERELQNIKIRQNDTHSAVLALRRDQAADAEVSAHLQAQIDAVAERLYRIERRLELQD